MMKKDDVKDLNEHWRELTGSTLSSTHEESIKRFLQDLTPTIIKEAMNLALIKVGEKRIDDIFRYFCGICHNKIAELRGHNYRRILKIFEEVQQYFLDQERGSGWHREDQLLEFCKKYPKYVLIKAIDIAFSTGRSNYWYAVCEALEEITNDEVIY